MQRAFPAVLIGLAVLWAAASGALAQDPRFFRIGTAATTGTYFQVGGVIASAISSPPGAPACPPGGACGIPGLVAVAQATQGSIENVTAIGAGQLESALAQADIAYWAWRGKGIFEKKGGVPKLRALAALFPETVHVVVRKDGPVAAIHDLKGRKVAIGEKESGTIADARLVLEAAGLTEKTIQPDYSRLGQAAGLLKDGSIDAFFLVGGWPVPAIADLAATTPIRLLPIDDKTFAALSKRFRFFARESIPAEAYPEMTEAVPTVAISALWVVSEDVPEELAYRLAKTLWSEPTRKLLEGRHPAGKRIRLENALRGVDIPVHPGAERFYREAGIAVEPPTE